LSGAAARSSTGGPGPAEAHRERSLVSAEELMSIGEVLAQLRDEFPDTTISKLRFLEAEGLVEPRRTPSGYRKYSRADVERLRYVLTAQRDQYLPLRVIREQLADDPVPAAEELTADELIERAEASAALLRDLEEHGLVTRAGDRYHADALAVTTVAARLAGYGLQARHLRAYRAAADREVGLFAQLVAPLARSSDPAARARAAETVRDLAELSGRLHAALVRAGLRDTLGG
jgi:DNA-binding transcriptional MerR regulator